MKMIAGAIVILAGAVVYAAGVLKGGEEGVAGFLPGIGLGVFGLVILLRGMRGTAVKLPGGGAVYENRDD